MAPPSPLIHKSSRSASAALDGYGAQVWRSVLAWLKLREEELLFLEYAEDFDIVGGPSVETIQVKNVRKPISLRSKDVVNAISNAWFTRTRNLGRGITYRFLTTSSISMEAGDPFGSGTPGLKLWQQLRQSKKKEERLRFAERLATFLETDERASAELRDFLAEAAPSDILELIIDPMIWDTGAGDVASVVQEIKDRLIGIGEVMHVDPSSSAAVADTLFSSVFEKAAASVPRRLSRSGLLTLFQQRTQIQVPVGIFMALVARHLDEPSPKPPSRRGDRRDADRNKRLPAPPPASEPARPRDTMQKAADAPGASDTLTQRIIELKGDRLAVVIGDAIDGEQALSKDLYFESMRRWRRENFNGADDAGTFRRREQEHAMALLNDPRGQISAGYAALSGLCPATIISLYPDPVLERTFSRYRRRTTDTDLITFDIGTGHNDLYLLGGSPILGSGLITNDEANLTIARRLDVLGLGFRDKLALCDILIVGIDETQFASRRVLRAILDHRTDRDGKILFIDSNVSPEFLAVWRAENLQAPTSTAIGMLRTSRRTGSIAAHSVPGRPSSPFKYLGYYDADDAAIFKGRTGDAERILREIKASAGRIAVLTGRSGAGKTSIINAMVGPELESAHDTLVVRTRCGDVPEASIIEACADRLGKVVDRELLAPQSFLTSLGMLLKDHERNCLVVIDQAEEVFVKLGHEVMQRFVANIETVLRSRVAPVRFLFVIRSDYLKDLFAINTATFPILGAPVHLDDMDWDQARAAIVEPLRLFGIGIEEGLIDLIMGDLDPERILPAQLSIICDRLYRELGETRNITLNAFRQHGLSTQSILIDHLGRSLGSVAVGDRPSVEALLEALVTGDGTKGLFSLDEIVQRTSLDEQCVVRHLHALIHECRLVREVEGETTRYELSHEILAEELHARIDRARAEIREVQDMLGREVASSQYRFDQLISPERLQLFDKMRNSLHLGPDAVTLIVASFAQDRRVPAHWRSAAESLPIGKLVEAALIRPVAAKCVHIGEVLRGGAGRVQLAKFKIMDLSSEARAVFESELEDQSVHTLAELAKFVSAFDGSRLGPTVLNKILNSAAISNIQGWDDAWRDLVVKAATSLSGCVLPENELRAALLSGRRIIAKIPPGDSTAERLKPFEAWLMKSLWDDEERGEWLADQVLAELGGAKLNPLDRAILELGCSAHRLSECVTGLPDCYPDLVQLLYEMDPEEAVQASLDCLHEMDLEKASAFAELAWSFAIGSAKFREFGSFAERARLGPQLIFLLSMLLGKPGVESGTEPEALLREALHRRLAELSAWAVAQFPDYGRSLPPLLAERAPSDDARAFSITDWKVFESYAELANSPESDGFATDGLWKGVCRLCLMAGDYGVGAAGSSLQTFIERNVDPDDRVLMLATLTAQAGPHAAKLNSRMRDFLLHQLFEHDASLSGTSQRHLQEIARDGLIPAYRVGALLVLQRWSPEAVTKDISVRALEGRKCALSALQASLIIEILDAFSPTWPDDDILTLFTASHPLATRMAGRLLLPRLGAFRGRPRLLKSALMAVRARTQEYRHKWLEVGQGAADEMIPDDFVALVLRPGAPRRAEIEALGRLYA